MRGIWLYADSSAVEAVRKLNIGPNIHFAFTVGDHLLMGVRYTHLVRCVCTQIVKFRLFKLLMNAYSELHVLVYNLIVDSGMYLSPREMDLNVQGPTMALLIGSASPRKFK